MKNSGLVVLLGIALLFGLAACQNRPLLTEAIYEDQSLFVRLAVDQTVGGDHSHPASMTTEEMTAVLSGLMVEEPSSLIPSVPFPGNEKEPPRHPAFRMEEIALLAPLLAKGLNTARPEEVVTFYWMTQQPAPIEHVTSGGVFVEGEELHFILSNYRSPTRYPPDPETMRSLDGRSTPLQPLVPQETRLTFNPTTALVPLEQGFFKNPFRSKRQEIVVLFQALAGDTVR
ncbi:MAG: hypothetical protein OEV99_00060 [Nitrospira sp.]|nr:hypothetical protein [Nitrospira sp.]MDH4368205.1 hypothetical protein [Nitrospira sp.]MDH5495887.1 hypothetical protein [Nitrospira sp.]MDH5723958.1 hypothetical protein [Nitrospira sp.]